MNTDRDRTASTAPIRRRTALLSALALGLGGIPPTPATAGVVDEPGRTAAPRASYDAVVLQDRPAAYWAMRTPRRGTEQDLSGHRHTGSYSGRPAPARLPNGDVAADFTGRGQYLQVPDADALSPATRGVLTVEAWMRPDTLAFPHTESTGYVHWMGKGEAGRHEYAARMYSAGNTEGRGNRISGYLFDASGGKGAGSYFQEDVRRGQWIHYVLVINAGVRSAAYPHGYTKIYRDGRLKDQDDLTYRGTVVEPTRGGAPLRIGTRDLRSFFEGAVGKVALYDRELSPARIARHHSVMTTR